MQCVHAKGHIVNNIFIIYTYTFTEWHFIYHQTQCVEVSNHKFVNSYKKGETNFYIRIFAKNSQFLRKEVRKLNN